MQGRYADELGRYRQLVPCASKQPRGAVRSSL